MLTAELIAWYSSFVIEAALIARLLAFRTKLQMFLIYLLFDLPRWATLAGIDKWGSAKVYRQVWLFTEPISIVLLACVGAEAVGCVFSRVFPRFAYYIICASSLALVILVPSVSDLPDERFFLSRAIIAAVIIASLITSQLSKIGAHGAILVGFCIADLIQNIAIIGGARGDITPGAILVFEQTACLILWLCFTGVIARQTNGIRIAD